MRTLFLMLILAVAVTTYGQKPWEKFEDMDSIEFVDQFGTIDQYNYQKSMEQKSSHKMLCVWTGAKAIWLYNFAMYLDQKQYNVEWDATDTEVIVRATPKIYTTSKPPMIKLRAPFNAQTQAIKSATITGPADDIIKIYIDYWQLTEFSFNDLKTKKAITKDFVSDKVTFSWTGSDPVITVTKNDSAPIDLFQF